MKTPLLLLAVFFIAAALSAHEVVVVPEPPTPTLGVTLVTARGQVRVATVTPAGPAAALGIRPGDVIESIGFNSVASVPGLRVALRDAKPGPLPIRLLRAGAAAPITVIFQRPAYPAPKR